MNDVGCCAHDEGEHVLVATAGDPMLGGVRLCPARGCDCYATWSPSNVRREDVSQPDDFVLAMLRARIEGAS